MIRDWRRSDLLTRRALLVPLVMVLLMARAARAEEIRVAAAADLKFAMKDVAAQFEKQTGTKVDVTCGSSGNFFSQLQNGAPFDLCFSADIDYPRKREAAGLAEPRTVDEYAVGRFAIWTPADAEVGVVRLGSKTLLDASEPAAMLLKASKNKTSARAFLEFLKSEGGRATLSKYGFTIPGANAARPSPNSQNK
jgi:ABC-type molybdate transport system substrate-binding protein